MFRGRVNSSATIFTSNNQYSNGTKQISLQEFVSCAIPKTIINGEKLGHAIPGSPTIPISPYQFNNGGFFYPPAAGDASSAGGRHRRHYRRRVAQFHQNRGGSQATQQEEANQFLQLDRCKSEENHKSFNKSQEICVTSPTVLPHSVPLSSLHKSSPVLCERQMSQRNERRALSVDPVTTTNSTDATLCLSPSVTARLGDAVLLQSPCAEWYESIAPNRAKSTPIVCDSNPVAYQQQLIKDSNLTPVQKNYTVRSRSHHQLLAIDHSSRTENSHTPVTPKQYSLDVDLPMGIIGSQDDAETGAPLVERYYTGSSHSERGGFKMARSPISVLAPCKGKLRLSIESQNGTIQLHFFEAKSLRTGSDAPCRSFIKVTVVPDKTNSLTQQTQPVESGSNPQFNETILLNLAKIRHVRRILISVYCQLTDGQDSELLGGMSFGLAGLQSKNRICGWYYLLNETMARKKHLKAGLEEPRTSDDAKRLSVPSDLESCPAVPVNRPDTMAPLYYPVSSQQPVLTPTLEKIRSPLVPNRNVSNQPSKSTALHPGVSTFMGLPKTNKALNNMQLYNFIISRGPKGFGFTLSGGCPVYVSYVEPGSPALQCGVKAGDYIMAVDRFNVSRSSADSVVRLFRSAQNSVCVTICRSITYNVQLLPTSRSSGVKSLCNLLPSSCFSYAKRSESNGQPRTNIEVAPNSYAQLLTNGCQTFTTLNNRLVPVFQPNTQQSFSNNTTNNAFGLPNSHSSYQVANIAENPLSPRLPSSKTENRLMELGSYVRPNSPNLNSVSTYSQQTTETNSPGFWETPVDLNLKDQCNDTQPNTHTTAVRLPKSKSNFTVCSSTGPTEATSRHACPTIFQNARAQLKSPVCIDPHGQPIVNCLKYVSHVQPVDFRVYSARLEHYGCLNLLEYSSCSKVDLLMFPELLLIAQRAPNRFFTVIKDPIYNTKICYVNIPPYASDQLILQYLDDANRKQIVHFQGQTVGDWLIRIQGHMAYNSSWWMNGVSSGAPVNF
ncbi:hypothetical protein CRM22_008060 [Opisthorchis felineus]|uniref:Uncharacterized protein n=1 Tax=Opisthorchis felineus TaxID=147828 RepID=A0A4S2LJY7_OPIFE|nr:hypothetical protein CRM22_008060 [Opisthorchis felineus]